MEGGATWAAGVGSEGVPAVRFAYADPPYLGECSRYSHEHERGGCWNDIETHRRLVDSLAQYDGWALSLSAPSLSAILPLVPDDVRVMAWCKKWASWKPGQWPAYGWEPVLMRSSVKGTRDEPTPRDWFACHVTTGAGFSGAKPEAFTRWVLSCLGVRPDDEFVDLFPGSGAVTEAYERWRAQQPLGLSA